MNRDLLEQIMVQLKVTQIDELAAVPPGNIPRPFEFIASGCRRFRRQLSAVCAAVHHDCFFLSHSYYQFTSKSHFKTAWSL